MTNRNKTRPSARRKKAPKKAETKPNGGAPFKFTGTADELLAAADKIRAERIPPRPESAWDNGAPNPNASMTTLAVALLEDFETDTPFILNRPLDMLTRTLRSVRDDCELINATGDGLDHCDTVRRVIERIRCRSEIAIEIARRLIVDGGES